MVWLVMSHRLQAPELTNESEDTGGDTESDWEEDKEDFTSSAFSIVTWAVLTFSVLVWLLEQQQ